MVYRLHNRLGSAGFAVEACLAAAGVDFDYDPMDSVPGQSLQGKISNVNPWNQIPVLELDDGSAITEVAAILAYLAVSEPAFQRGPVLWIDDLAQLLRWSVFLSVNVNEALLRQTYTERFIAPLPADMADPAAEAVREAANTRIDQALKTIEAATAEHKFLLSDRPTPCDVYLAMLYGWYGPKPDLPKCTWITTQIATNEVIRPLWEKNFQGLMEVEWHDL